MNSLSSFENSKNPLKAFLVYMAKYANESSKVRVSKGLDHFSFGFPKPNCSIKVMSGTIIVQRIGFDYDNVSTYHIQSITQAKELISILSGVCAEYGCTYKEADDAVYLMLKQLHELTFNEEESLCGV